MKRSSYHVRQRSLHPNGFTLVELLVVIAIIGILVALLLPAVQSAREAARKTACMNNFKQVGVAFQNHLSAKQILPAGTEYNRTSEANCPFADSSFSQQAGFGWGTFLLPYLEEGTIYDGLDFKKSIWSSSAPKSNWDGIAHIIDVFICPSELNDAHWVDSSSSRGHFGDEGWDWPLANMAGVADSNKSHCWLYQPVGDGNGVLFNFSGISMKDITDGSSHTFLVGEMVSAKGIDGSDNEVWVGTTWVTRSVADVHHGVNGPGSLPGGRDDVIDPFDGDGGNRHDEYFRENGFSSWHPGGAHFLFSDGSVNFLNSDTDLLVLCAHATRNREEIISEGTATDSGECVP